MAGEAPNVQIDLIQYLAAKKAGAARLLKIEGKIHYSQRRFNPLTGEPSPLLIPMDRKGLEDYRDHMLAQAAAADQMLKDMDAAQEVAQPPAPAQA